jgi:hypothetical protein
MIAQEKDSFAAESEGKNDQLMRRTKLTFSKPPPPFSLCLAPEVFARSALL